MKQKEDVPSLKIQNQRALSLKKSEKWVNLSDSEAVI